VGGALTEQAAELATVVSRCVTNAIAARTMLADQRQELDAQRNSREQRVSAFGGDPRSQRSWPQGTIASILARVPRAVASAIGPGQKGRRAGSPTSETTASPKQLQQQRIDLIIAGSATVNQDSRGCIDLPQSAVARVPVRPLQVISTPDARSLPAS